MLFEDSIEFENVEIRLSCVAVKLKTHISLEDIWIPSSLLPNRKRAIDCDSNRSIIFSTLERRNGKSFSTYSDDENSGKQIFAGNAEVHENLTFPLTQSDSNPSNLLSIESPFNSIKDSLEELYFSDEKVNVTENLIENKCKNEVATELPITYKRPAFREISTKQKSQKGKKNRKASKNLSLGDFLQSVDSNGYRAPERDEFYENLVRRGLGTREALSSSVNNFPRLYKPPQIEFFGSSNVSELHEKESSILPFKTCAQSLFKQSESTCNEREKRQSDAVEPETMSGTSSTIILENVPKSINKEDIESLLSHYGKLEKMTLRSCGNFLKARVRMIFENDVDWTVECLNDSTPFEVSCVLKCYKLWG